MMLLFSSCRTHVLSIELDKPISISREMKKIREKLLSALYILRILPISLQPMSG